MSVGKLLILSLTFLTSLAFAEEPEEFEVHSSVELAKGICADPTMTDEQRAEMVSRSLEDAEKCMGHEWVYGGMKLVHQSALGKLEIEGDVSANRVRVNDRSGKLHVYLTSPGVPNRKGKDPTETATGDYTGPFRVEDGNYTVQSRDVAWFGAAMPWAVFYKHNTGYAIHGTDDLKNLGKPASHGCLRLTRANARTINAWVREQNDSSVTIRVHGKVATRTPAPQARRPQPRPRPDDFDDYREAPRPRRRPPVERYDEFGGYPDLPPMRRPRPMPPSDAELFYGPL